MGSGKATHMLTECFLRPFCQFVPVIRGRYTSGGDGGKIKLRATNLRVVLDHELN